MNFIHNIIVTGNWSAGKTTSCKLLQGLLSQETGVKRVLYDSDRLEFEKTVRRDLKEGCREENGVLIGENSMLVADGPPGRMSFRVLKGPKFNKAHQHMIARLADAEPGVITVVEYAIGPNTSYQEGEPLDQSSHFLTEQLIQSGAAGHTLLIQLYRPFGLRRQSNLTREDPTDMDAFDKYGQEGGLMMPEDAARLGENFLHLNNVGSLEALVANTYRDHIQPRLAIAMSIEGGFYARKEER